MTQADDFTIPAEYGRHIAAQLSDMHLSVEDWLSSAGLTAETALLSTLERWLRERSSSFQEYSYASGIDVPVTSSWN